MRGITRRNLGPAFYFLARFANASAPSLNTSSCRDAASAGLIREAIGSFAQLTSFGAQPHFSIIASAHMCLSVSVRATHLERAWRYA